MGKGAAQGEGGEIGRDAAFQMGYDYPVFSAAKLKTIPINLAEARGRRIMWSYKTAS
jgi:hypothetical protein